MNSLDPHERALYDKAVTKDKCLPVEYCRACDYPKLYKLTIPSPLQDPTWYDEEGTNLNMEKALAFVKHSTKAPDGRFVYNFRQAEEDPEVLKMDVALIMLILFYHDKQYNFTLARERLEHSAAQAESKCILHD